MNVLLGQLNANGDCLYATILARQMKEDFPGCKLTWAISSQCRDLLKGNPDVDRIWEFTVDSFADREKAWWALEEQVLRIQTGPDPFERVALPQISPGNFRYYDGTIRPSILRAYQAPVTVPIDSVIVLDESEKQKVISFVDTYSMENYEHRILFECSSSSGQSYVTPAFALQVAERVTSELDSCCFVLSTHEKIKSFQKNVFFARELSMRENAELTHHCTLFVGCGSGLTVVATSTIAKEIPNIQILSSDTSVYASFFHDFEWFGKPSDRFIEMSDASVEHVASSIITCCRNGLRKARSLFHRPLPVTFDFYCQLIETCLLRKKKYYDAFQSMEITVSRYGLHDRLALFAKTKILPFLHDDILATDPEAKSRIDETMSFFNSIDPTFK